MKTSPKCQLLLIGDELTNGAISDTNGKWLSERLTPLGVEVTGITVVRDRIEEIVKGLELTIGGSDLVIATGGLGPTSDDLTRDAVAKFLGENLVESESTLKKIKDLYEKRGIPFNKISTRQALFPESSIVINNSVGSADSFCVESWHGKETLFFSLPGVPSEVKVIFDEEVLPKIKGKFSQLQEPATSFLRCFGLSESAVGDAIEDCNLGGRFIVSYRPVFPEVWVKFSGVGLTKGECEKAARIATEAIGPAHVVSDSPELSLAQVTLKLLKEKKLSVSLAESCSGGLAANLIIAEPGASAVFKGGIVCYADEVKTDLVGVEKATLQRCGAVSKEVALELAKGIKEKTNSSIGISITGVAGPEGGSAEKPVGTVFFGYCSGDNQQVVSYLIPMERNRFRLYTAHIALDLVRRELLNQPLQFQRR